MKWEGLLKVPVQMKNLSFYLCCLMVRNYHTYQINFDSGFWFFSSARSAQHMWSGGWPRLFHVRVIRLKLFLFLKVIFINVTVSGFCRVFGKRIRNNRSCTILVMTPRLVEFANLWLQPFGACFLKFNEVNHFVPGITFAMTNGPSAAWKNIPVPSFEINLWKSILYQKISPFKLSSMSQFWQLGFAIVLCTSFLNFGLRLCQV